MSKTSIDADAVRQLAGILTETELTEIEYESETVRIRVSKGVTAVSAASPATSPATSPAAAPVATAASATTSAGEAEIGAVTSPMVGVIYTAPEPGAAAFIQVGDTVAAGETLMLIEAMKTFNPVRTEKGGKVSRILVSDGQAVEYGEPLVIIE